MPGDYHALTLGVSFRKVFGLDRVEALVKEYCSSLVPHFISFISSGTPYPFAPVTL